ncbi:MAG: hypothetical protein V4650_08215 [Pseudomonadota bacterium]
MRQSIFAAAMLSTFALPATAQVISLPVLVPGGALAGITTQVFSALPAPLTTSAPLPADVTVLENGSNGSGIRRVLGLGGNNITSTVIGNQLNNTVGTPLVGLPTGTAQPIDVAILGGDGVGNSNVGGIAGIAALSGSNVANGGLAGVGVLNRNNSGRGQLLGVAALSGRNSGHASQGLGVGLLNRGETLGVSAGGARVLTLGSVKSQAQGALPGLDMGGLAIGGGKPTVSRNALLNAGVLAGDGAGSGGLVGVAALSGSDAANAQLLGVGVLNQDGSSKGLVGVDVLSGNGSGVSSNGVGIAALSGDGSGTGSMVGAGALTGSNSGTGGLVGAGLLSGSDSGRSQMAGVAALSGSGSGSGGAMGGDVASSSPSSTGDTGAGGGGAGDGSTGGGTGSGDGSGSGNDSTAGNGSSGSSGSGSAFSYNGAGESGGARRQAAAAACQPTDRDAKGRALRPEQCTPKIVRKV